MGKKAVKQNAYNHETQEMKRSKKGCIFRLFRVFRGLNERIKVKSNPEIINLF